MDIYYPIPETMPDNRARFIQTANTCQALARAGGRVCLITGLKKGWNSKTLLGYYGLSGHPNLRIVKLPMLRADGGGGLRLSWHGVFHLSLLSYLLKEKYLGRSRGVVYLRHLKLAEYLIRCRTWLNMPVVYEAHEIFRLTTDNEKSQGRIGGRENRVLRDCDGVVCISRSLGEMVLEIRGDGGGVQVVPCGVKDEWLRPSHEQAGSFILYAGSLYPWKGVDTLIRAAVHLPQERIVIVGGGDRLEELKALAAGLGVSERVEFTGAVAHGDLPKFLSQAKIAVLPNAASGTSHFSSPLKLFEYMAQGLPIAASDLPPFREILRDGVNALLFKPGDARALAGVLDRLVHDPGLAAGLAKQARLAAEDFTYARRGHRLLEILQPLLK
jgi:glycosyltransferase involved in cell wall biosynthesis